MTKVITLFLALCQLLCISPLSTPPLEIRPHDESGFYLMIPAEELLGMGFALGDSVDVKLSNGVTLEDLPLYNGYYVKTDTLMLRASTGSSTVRALIYNGKDLYTAAGLTEGCTGVITLRERGKYRDVQESLSMEYTDERTDYADDVQFGNFREMRGGKLAEGLFYRAATPCNPEHNRAAAVSALCGQAGIRCFLDLADNADALSQFAQNEDIPYWREIYAAGGVLPLKLAYDYRSGDYAKTVCGGLMAMMEKEGPYLIHCKEGKDRTGFVCLLLEALAGASIEEIIADYMVTYDNYYGFDRESDPVRYNAVVEISVMDMITFLQSCADENAQNALADGVEKYCAMGGLTDGDIARLKAFLAGKE